MAHAMEVPDHIWDYWVDRTNMSNPASKLRDILGKATIADAKISPVIAVLSYETELCSRRAKLGLLSSPLDPDGDLAYKWGIEQCSSEAALLDDIEKRDLNNPRAYLLSRWREATT